ncbi:MAG: flagellar hook-associated protein FlgK [Roseburia sp.]|nr:flagellar hook-associated protein FlgK [Roseburia sp.]
MPSTFFGLTIASSGLNAFQVALNTTANNISNVQTKGYTRQQANRVASDAMRVYTKYGSMGTGVTTESIKQIRNQYYDTRYWYNQSSVGLYETRLNYLEQIENYFIDDDSAKGFSTILNKMFNALDTLQHTASDVNVRQQFIGSAQNLATYFNGVAEGLGDIQSTVNEEIKSTVLNINAIAQKISVLNKEINVIELQGGYANELRDQRALLIDELSEIVPVEVSEVPVTNTNDPEKLTGANYYTVRIGGQLLVDTYDYYELKCVVRENRVNQSDIDGLYDIKWAATGNTFNGGASYMSGSLKALFDIRDGNNGDNFSGVTTVQDSMHLKITEPSQTSQTTMTMPEQGVLKIDGKEYAYNGFTYEKNADGEIISYTFNLKNGLSNEQIQKVDGCTAAIGESVDSMGIPYYQAQMNEFLRCFTEKFNNILKQGQDLNAESTDYYAFFTGTDTTTGIEYVFDGTSASGATGSDTDDYYKLTAFNVGVSSICIKSPEKLGVTWNTSDNGVDRNELAVELGKLKSDVVLYRGGNAEGFLKCMISDVTIDTQESKIFYQNYQNVANAISNQRMSISGVDEDEEGLDLIKFQNAYNLSSKMISVMAEIYDRLILETGV